MSELTYKYQGEEFIITKPDTCTMKVTKGQYTAVISIHTATNRFRESLDGWGTDQDTLQGALDNACRRILKKLARPSAKELCSELDKFYEKLSDSKTGGRKS